MRLKHPAWSRTDGEVQFGLQLLGSCASAYQYLQMPMRLGPAERQEFSLWVVLDEAPSAVDVNPDSPSSAPHGIFRGVQHVISLPGSGEVLSLPVSDALARDGLPRQAWAERDG